MIRFIKYCIFMLLFFSATAGTSFSETSVLPATDVYSLYNNIKDEKYIPEFDDPLTVTGIVIETGISIYATPYVSLSNKNEGTVYATCVLPRADALKLKEFKKGNRVTLQGNYYAFKDKAVIKKCKKIDAAEKN